MNLAADHQIAYCISEGRATSENYDEIKRDILAKVRNADARGVGLFQIREKRLPALLLYKLTRESVEAAGKAKVIVNGRADVALAAGAHGVHLPSDGLPVPELRAVVPPGFIIGVSTHTIDDVLRARAVSADLITFGPVFASPGKGAGVGVNELTRACRAAGAIPVIALGGIDENTVESTFVSGVAGYAAIRYLNQMLAE